MRFLKNLLQKLQDFYTVNPFLVIILTAFFVRLIAVVFSKGYGMHDDHFLVIEASQSWVDGTDYNNWLPQNRPGRPPDGHSFFYVGIHYILFCIFKFIGILNPDVKMFIIRIIHALLSLLVVIGGYKIAELKAGKKVASRVGLFLALFWFMPFLSVRNLVEIVAIPLLMYALWITKKSLNEKRKLLIFVAGFIMGFAVSVRFQTILFVGGTGLALLFMKKWKEAFIFGGGAILNILIFQGITDLLIWKYPFAELKEYILYNMEFQHSYGNNNYSMYPLIIFGFLLPPVSLFLIFGFFKEWRRNLLVFLPTLIFFLFHEYFPNKQERFILTIVPFIILLGFIGWESYISKSAFWEKRKKTVRGSYFFFWIVNIFLLILATTTYSKKSRVEAMLNLYPDRNKINSILLDNNNQGGTLFVPLFYLGKWIDVYQFAPDIAIQDTLSQKHYCTHQSKIFSLHFFDKLPEENKPQFILFYNNNNIKDRIRFFQEAFPELTYRATIKPGLMDRIMYKINPVNVNEVIYIYSVKK